MKMYLSELLEASHTRLPSKKEEKWRLSPLNKYLKKEYVNRNLDHKESFSSCPNEFNICIEDGHVLRHHLPMYVHIKKVSFSHEDETNPFASLATKSCECTFELHVFENVKLNIYLDYSKAAFGFSSLNIILNDGVRAEIFFHFAGGEESFISHSSHIKLLEKAELFISEIQELHTKAALISQNYFHLEENSQVNAFYLMKEAEYLHNFIICDLHYKSEINVSSLLLSKERQNSIFSCDINHLASASKSSVFSKQVLKDESTCVFDANTQICKNTKGTVAKQASHALLLDERAQIHSKPHLEIYSDDLSASHGSTVGQLDENALSYLHSRGISEKMARHMLVQAFIQEPIEHIKIAEHKEKILSSIGEIDELL